MTPFSSRRRSRGLLALCIAAACLILGAYAPVVAEAQSPPLTAATPFRPDGVLASDPALVNVPQSGLAAFLLGTDGAVWWGTNTTAWSSLGAPPPGLANDPPAVVSWSPGRIDVFARGADNKLWQRWSPDSGATWSGWLQPVGTDGTLASAPAVTSEGPGEIDVVVQGTDHNYYLRSWNTSSWSGAWLSVGAPAAGAVAGEAAAVTSYGPGRLDVFVRAQDNHLWQLFFVPFVPTMEVNWFQPLGTKGTLNSAPATQWWGMGGALTLSVFVQGTDGRLYEASFDRPTGHWATWGVEGASSNVLQGDPAVVTTPRFTTYVAVRGTDNLCYLYIPQFITPES